MAGRVGHERRRVAAALAYAGGHALDELAGEFLDRRSHGGGAGLAKHALHPSDMVLVLVAGEPSARTYGSHSSACTQANAERAP